MSSPYLIGYNNSKIYSQSHVNVLRSTERYRNEITLDRYQRERNLCKREEDLKEKDELDKREEELDKREDELDKREEELDKREEELDESESVLNENLRIVGIRSDILQQRISKYNQTIMEQQEYYYFIRNQNKALKKMLSNHVMPHQLTMDHVFIKPPHPIDNPGYWTKYRESRKNIQIIQKAFRYFIATHYI